MISPKNGRNDLAATIENVRDFWDQRPCNLRHSRAEIGSRQYYDEVERRKYFIEPHIPAFAEFERWNGKKVLEIGCGIGTDAVSFARAGADYSGIELSKASIELTKNRFRVYGLHGKFYLGDAEEIFQIIPLQTFDLIYAFGVLHHMPQPQRVIDSVKEYMGRESEFRLMMYAKNSWKNIMIASGFDQPEAQYGCPIANTYTQDELKVMLRSYNIVEMRQDHIFPYIINKYINYEYEWQPWFRAMPDAMFAALQNAFGWHTLIKCRLKSS